VKRATKAHKDFHSEDSIITSRTPNHELSRDPMREALGNSSTSGTMECGSRDV